MRARTLLLVVLLAPLATAGLARADSICPAAIVVAVCAGETDDHAACPDERGEKGSSVAASTPAAFVLVAGMDRCRWCSVCGTEHGIVVGAGTLAGGGRASWTDGSDGCRTDARFASPAGTTEHAGGSPAGAPPRAEWGRLIPLL